MTLPTNMLFHGRHATNVEKRSSITVLHSLECLVKKTTNQDEA